MPRPEVKANEWPPRVAREADIQLVELRLQEERQAKRVKSVPSSFVYLQHV